MDDSCQITSKEHLIEGEQYMIIFEGNCAQSSILNLDDFNENYGGSYTFITKETRKANSRYFKKDIHYYTFKNNNDNYLYLHYDVKYHYRINIDKIYPYPGEIYDKTHFITRISEYPNIIPVEIIEPFAYERGYDSDIKTYDILCCNIFTTTTEYVLK